MKKTVMVQEEIRSQIVKKKMNLFETTKKRSNNLKKLFHTLITIKPKSTEPRFFFSHRTICHRTQKQIE